MQHKTPKQKQKAKNPTVVELIKANAMLNQNCINLHNHLSKCEMDINSLYHQNLFLKHELVDLKGVLEVFAMKIGLDRDAFERSMERESESPKRRVQKEVKALPLHDDITVRCPACSTVNNKDFKVCNNCGYKK